MTRGKERPAGTKDYEQIHPLGNKQRCKHDWWYDEPPIVRHCRKCSIVQKWTLVGGDE